MQLTNLASLRDQYAALEQKASAGDFWEDQDRAQATLQQMSELRGTMQDVEGFQSLLGDVQTALELAEMEASLLLMRLTLSRPPLYKHIHCKVAWEHCPFALH